MVWGLGGSIKWVLGYKKGSKSVYTGAVFWKAFRPFIQVLPGIVFGYFSRFAKGFQAVLHEVRNCCFEEVCDRGLRV